MTEQLIEQTVEVLRQGGTLLYPTDTIWGVGCDARNTAAVERLYAIKERDRSKSMLVLCTADMARHLPANSPASTQSAASASERPTTYILTKKIWQPLLGDTIADNLIAADGSLGIRIPRHAFCQEVIRRLGAPLVSTSANLSGHPSPMNYEDIEEELKRRVDFCVPPLPEFRSGETTGSRIIKVNPDGSQTLLRP